MDKFQKLSQLSKEIQILETAGKIKAAEVLHKKFIKESQYMMPQMMPMMMMPQMMPQMMMARPTATVAPAAVARPVVNQTPAAAPKPVVAPTPVQQGQQSQTGQTGQVTPPAQSTTPPATQPPVVNPPVTTPPPMPIDKIKRQYGDGQSKNEELQYLDKEKRRLEELGYNDPKSPFYQQYLTIIGMINRNKGGSIIKKSENMNKSQKLAQLNKDIELLEAAGKFKAAEILQKKFVKEAQLKSAKDLMTEFNTLSQNPNADFDNLVQWWGRNYINYSEDDQAYVNKTIQDRKKQRQNMGTFSTTIKPQSQTLSSFETAVPAIQPQNSDFTDPTAPIGRLSDQVQAEQADFVTRGLGNTIQTGKENMDIQAKYRMTPQENEAENQLYSSTINEIKKLLATGNETQRNYARGLYQNTRQKFKNLKRQYLYDQQYAAIDRNPNKKQ